MRTRDKARFADLGRQLRDIRLGLEPPEGPMNTHDLAGELERTQPWVSEVENGERYLDVFDFVRWCRALGLEDGDAYNLLKSVVDDPDLTVNVTPKAPISRPKHGAKRRRKVRPRP